MAAEHAHAGPMPSHGARLAVHGESTRRGLTSVDGLIAPSATARPMGSCHYAGGMLYI
jgi:hypothetical protein